MTQAHSRQRALDQRYYGVVQALVVEVNDPEHEGRVKIKYPSIDNSTISDWCRVQQLYAGKGYGSLFVPEVNDEVLVAFVHGDMHEPIVLGGLYNGPDKPSTHRDDQTDKKIIRTKGGHQLVFDDQSGEKAIVITTDGGHELSLDDEGQKVTLMTSSGHQLVIDNRAGSASLETSSGHSVKIENSGTITVKATNVVVDATNVQLGGTSASNPLVLGNALLSAFNTHTHNCTAPGTPSGPPVPPLTPAVLSQKVKTS